ncbi:MAG: anthranilate synthase component I [Cyanobacteria bacterium J06643_4]
MLGVATAYRYQTQGQIRVSRSMTEVPLEGTLENMLQQLNGQVGGLLSSSYEYPGRYKRWTKGYVNPPLSLETKGASFALKALNARGEVLIDYLAEHLCKRFELKDVIRSSTQLSGRVPPSDRLFTEEERSKQPSAFTIVRAIMKVFHSSEDEYLGLYGAMGYDLVFQFEPIEQQRDRDEDQRDLALYLPDRLVVVDYYQQKAFQIDYDFETQGGATAGLPRDGKTVDYRGDRKQPERTSDYPPDGYAKLVGKALEYFERGDFFEVVLSQCFFESCEAAPADIFRQLRKINPSPYCFIFNLGGEYLIGASPEMFVRVDGRRVETCPISGTISRGKNAIEDSLQVRLLLNSVKDESELTMCTDVDRNDKSRICEPGSVKVIGRRQVEMYSHLIHTVDHVEGILCPAFDGLDAFLTHTWAVTVTGAPKPAALAFLEKNECSNRRWYGGAVGSFLFNGNVNTGLTLRAIRLKDSVAEIRVGATILYDSDPQAEAEETLVKAAAMRQALNAVKLETRLPKRIVCKTTSISPPPNVLLIDHEDSFVHTLANYIRQTGAKVTTLRHGFPMTMLDQLKPDLVVFSPGPGSPKEFKMGETIMACVLRSIPIFGVCLGLQGIVEYFDGKLGVLSTPRHGKSSLISVKKGKSVLFKNLPRHFEAGRYHSLHALSRQLPTALKVTAMSADNVVMAVEHKSLPIWAVQFHPESIMTLANDTGITIVQNVVDACAVVHKKMPAVQPMTQSLTSSLARPLSQ